jgi:valyl-tRNA synthetase
MLPKTFAARDIEARIFQAWQDTNAFAAGPKDRVKKGAESYCIVIPPPNVTGSLHMGHALDNTLQDILIRHHRMRGKDVLWQPGTDHAGIATQSVVERQLAARKEPDRRAMGREAFIKRVWEWKAESGGTIVGQLKRLGCSCDWSRERFTMDEGLSRAVTKVFVELHRAGLIYKDKRLVNWDPKLLTAISDLEVQQVETKSHLWYFNYPIKDAGRLKKKFITVATTRPETMLGDTAVAVNPKDKRWKAYVGKTVLLPLTGREIPIVADDYADPEQGSGAVKITPAHDFNDFEVGRRHNLPLINIFDPHACLNENVPEAYRGLDRFEARKRVVADLEALGLVEKIDPYLLKAPHGDRSGVVVEPYLTDQWYVDAKTLAKPAIEAVEQGRTAMVPENWTRTYYEWMRNIQPWCISRQIWWGHQIPAWYGPDGEVFVAHDEKEAKAAAKKHYGKAVDLRRDEDVLDTWFSSALWPFSTLGWPDKTPELERYYPNTVLVTGYDIIFFWVARMMMMGMHFMKEVPFRTVCLHGLVLDEKGQKMSKSKGNVIDPLEVIDEFGADALRLTMAMLAAQGRGIKMSKKRVEGYRNFGTKLWNASRFAEMNGCVPKDGFDPQKANAPVNRWIAAETQRLAAAVTAGIDAYKFNESANALYQFVWHVFCDWYLELIKPVLTGGDEALKAETQGMTAWVLDQILILLHPFMPFITEELWQQLAEAGGVKRAQMLVLTPWPELPDLSDDEAEAEMSWVLKANSEIRSALAEFELPAGTKVEAHVIPSGAKAKARMDAWKGPIASLAGLKGIKIAKSVPKGSVQILLDGAVAALPLAGVVDLAAEAGRIQKRIAATQDEIEKLDAKLANEQFVSRAPVEVVEENRERRAGMLALTGRLADMLKRIEAAV